MLPPGLRAWPDEYLTHHQLLGIAKPPIRKRVAEFIENLAEETLDGSPLPPEHLRALNNLAVSMQNQLLYPNRVASSVLSGSAAPPLQPEVSSSARPAANTTSMHASSNFTSGHSESESE